MTTTVPEENIIYSLALYNLPKIWENFVKNLLKNQLYQSL